MNRQILKPQVDVPLVVRLDKGPEGKETTSRGELQYQYTLNHDECVMWLPPEARTAILRTQAQVGDEIQIVKSLRGRNAIWNVQVLADAAEPPQRTTRMVAPRPAYPTATDRIPAAAGGNGHRDRYAETMSRPIAPAAAQPAAAAAETIGAVMQRALEIAARANWAAYTAAKAAGWEIDAPTWEDVRAAGISIFIEHNRNGGGR